MEQYTVSLTRPAVRDLGEITYHVAHILKVPQTARNLRDALEQGILSLSQFPARCPLVSDMPYRQKGVRRLLVENYAVFYLVDKDRRMVSILRILYNRREWQRFLEESYE